MTNATGGTEQLQETESVGAFLRRHRELTGVGLRELARHIGYTHAYISQIETGRRPISLDKVCLIANAIGECAAKKDSA